MHTRERWGHARGWLLLGALAWLVGAGPLAAKLPPGAEVLIEGNEPALDAFEEKDGESVAVTRARVTVAIPPDATSVRLTWRASTLVETAGGGPEKDPTEAIGDAPAATVGPLAERAITLDVTWADRAVEHLTVVPANSDFLPDALLQLPWGLKVYTRPNFEFYVDDRRAAVNKNLRPFPAASSYPLTLEWRLTPGGTELWADGRYARDWPGRTRLARMVLSVPRGAAIREWQWTSEKPSPFRPLTLEPLARADATLVKPVPALALAKVNVPLRLTERGQYLAVAGLGRLRCPVDDLVSFYWRRGAFDGLSEVRMITVPCEPYVAAHVLCAAPAREGRAPGFTLRLTRYGSGRGGAMADSVVQVPPDDAPDTPAARRVGSLGYDVGGTRLTTPLWLLRVPLKVGLIQDLMLEDERPYGIGSRLPVKRYLDLEIMDPIPGVDAHDAFPPSMKPTGRWYTPGGASSAAVIVGLTLETAPAALTVRINPPGFAAYAAEKPELQATVAGAAGSYTLAWELADVDGKLTPGATPVPVTLTAAQPSVTAAVPLAGVGLGWYAWRVRLLDADGRELADNRGTFVLLPPNTRTAGFESPHGAWWFHWAHGGAPDFARVGPMYQRAGLRHANLPKSTEAQTKAYDLYPWCVTWNGKLLEAGTTAEKVAAYEAYIRENVTAFPSLTTVMFWHESGGGGAPVPSELWGQPPPPPSLADDEGWKSRLEVLAALVAMVREKFPGMKTQFGNCGDSCAIVGELMRRKFPPENIDYIAVEDLGQTFIPERPLPGAMQSAWLLRETARTLGYPQARITACYEWIGRRDAALGLGGQAEWYVRDALQARAYGFHTFMLGVLHDAGQGYFHTIWGSTGLCHRYPYMYPKPAYAALATLTRLLDGAKFVRVLPTGSHVLYAVEYQGPAGARYALWSPRGRREATLTFAADTTATVTDLYGRERTATGRELKLDVGEGACYVTAGAALAQVAAGRATFPDELPPADVAVVEPLDDAARFTLVTEKDKRLERTSGWNLPHRTRGEFDLRVVDDAEKGRCLEVALKPVQPVSWALQHEYAYLAFPQAAAAPGTRRGVGVWVKGNGGWGDVMWEVTNAKGEKWLTTGVYWDWPGKLAINFDGWHFVRLELNEKWRLGLKVTGLVITMPRQVLQVTEMTPVKNLTVRVKDVCVF